MKINSNILFFTLIACGYIYSDIAHLEKQIADKIIYRNVLLEKHTQDYPNQAPRLNVFKCCIDSTLTNMPKVYIELTKKRLEEQCKNLTQDALWHAIFKNEQDIVTLKDSLLAPYNDHNNALYKTLAKWNLGAAVVLFSAFYACMTKGYINKKDITADRLTGVASMGFITVVAINVGISRAKEKSTPCLTGSITISKARLYDYIQQMQKENKVDEK